MHRLADEVLPQHRPQRGAAIAVAREGREACALQLKVAENTVVPSEFSEKNCAPVTQLRHEGPELVPCIGHRDRVCIVWQLITGEHGRCFTLDEVRFQSKIFGQAFVENDELRVRDDCWISSRVEPARQGGIAVLEP
jgi:hypothetical protein